MIKEPAVQHGNTNQHGLRDYSPLSWVLSMLLHVIVGLGMVLILEAPHGASPQSRPQLGILLERFKEKLNNQSEQHVILAEEIVAEVEFAEAPTLPKEMREKQAADLPVPETEGAVSSPDQPLSVTSTIAESASIFADSFPQTGYSTVGDALQSSGRRWPRVSGSQARTGVFGVEGVGTKFVYLFDRSVSMEGTPLAAAKSQLVKSLESLGDIHHFQIIFFNHRLTIFDHTDGQGRIAYATDNNKSLAAKFVRLVSADGGTDRYAALGHAIRLRPDVIFFLTDADDPMPASELAEIAKKNQKVGASINTIEFGRGVDSGQYNFLVRLAEQSGGQHGYVNTRRLGEK